MPTRSIVLQWQFPSRPIEWRLCTSVNANELPLASGEAGDSDDVRNCGRHLVVHGVRLSLVFELDSTTLPSNAAALASSPAAGTQGGGRRTALPYPHLAVIIWGRGSLVGDTFFAIRKPGGSPRRATPARPRRFAGKAKRVMRAQSRLNAKPGTLLKIGIPRCDPGDVIIPPKLGAVIGGHGTR